MSENRRGAGERAPARERVDLLFEPLDQRHQRLDDRGFVQLGLGGEVAEQVRLGDPGAGRDLTQPPAGQPALGEHLERGGQDRLPALVGTHPPRPGLG
jgi:hypothetical protein